MLLFVLSAMLIFCAAAVTVPYETAEARTIFDIESELKEYKDELAKLQSELTTIRSNISKLEEQSGQNTELLAEYIAEIEALEVDIMATEAYVESYDLKRAETITEMAIVREDYEYRLSMYKKLMQFIYENSEVNSFELLFSSENLSDFLTRRDHFNDIMNSANTLLREIELSIAELEELDASLQETQKKYDEYLTSLNRTKLEKEQRIDEINTIAAELGLNIDDLQAQYSSKNERINQIKSKISELEEERREAYSSNAAFIWPVAVLGTVTSQYGWRGDPFGKPTTEYHKGIDIACAKGTPIYAVKDGIVTRASWNGGYGECVIIYHGNGISSLYAHCDNTSSSRAVYEVKVGDTVKAGQVIAYVGTTGRSTGYHLHFGVIDTNTYTSLGGNYVNPNLYLPDGYYTKKS